MRRKKQDQPKIEGDLLSPALLSLVFGRPAEPKLATAASISDRVLSLYLDGVLGQEDVARVESALNSDPGLKAHLEDLKRVLAEAEEEVPVPPKPSSERFPDSARIHIGDIPLGKGPGLYGRQLRRVRELTDQLSGVFGSSGRAGSGTVDKRGIAAASRLLEDIRGAMQGSPEGEAADWYRFEGAGVRVEAAVSARAIGLSVHSDTDDRGIQGIEVSLASDAGELVTTHTDDLGHAEVPFPISNACLIVMASSPLEIGLIIDD